jgi:hypothetical protein
VLPDGSIFVQGLSKSGLTLNLMVNNLIYWDYHRPNGFTTFKHKFNNSIISDKLYTSTEGFLSLVNFFSNSFLKNFTRHNQKLIAGFTSPTVDSDFAASFLESIVGTVLSPGFIETIVFPLGQCLGLPIMLYVLVMEKEEKLKSLLEIMGLKSSNYWRAYIIFYFLMFMASNLIFYLVGKLLLGGKFFQKANSLLLVSSVFLVSDFCWLGPKSNRISTFHEHFY